MIGITQVRVYMENDRYSTMCTVYGTYIFQDKNRR